MAPPLHARSRARQPNRAPECGLRAPAGLRLCRCVRARVRARRHPNTGVRRATTRAHADRAFRASGDRLLVVLQTARGCRATFGMAAGASVLPRAGAHRARRNQRRGSAGAVAAANLVLGRALPARAPAVRRIDERLQLYSVIFFWASAANVALIMSTFES